MWQKQILGILYLASMISEPLEVWQQPPVDGIAVRPGVKLVRVTEGGSGGTGGSGGGGGGGYVPNSKDGCCRVGEDRIWENNFLLKETPHTHAKQYTMFYDFKRDPWLKVSDDAKDLVKRMLDSDPKGRLIAQEALDPWLQDAKKAPNIPLGDSVKARLKQFSVMNKLKKRALMVIAEHLSVEEVATIKEVFEIMDTNKRGKINLEELRVGVQKVGHQIPDADLQILMEAADFDGDGALNYGEFVTVSVHLRKLANDEHLHKAFAFFDLKKSGYIDLEELRAALGGEDDSNSDEVINAIMHDLDLELQVVRTDQWLWFCDDKKLLFQRPCSHTFKEDGRISYDEFAVMMKADSLMSIASHIIKVHASAGSTTGDTRVSKEDNWLKRYIQYCRIECKPRLSDSAATKLKLSYVKIRQLHKRLKERLNHAVDSRAECQREHSTCDARSGCCHGKESKTDGATVVAATTANFSQSQSHKKEDHEGKTQEKRQRTSEGSVCLDALEANVLLNQLVSSPFAEEINLVTLPAGFSQPKFNKDDAKTNAYTHLVQFMQVMSLHS
ncbi:hypothetical protein RHGRI_001160 [Rhododendron griersonianum]|uniref:DNA helicase n=1 Tax=Rhododendron griersonianum TaxID=479676 RepID=A0AAV6LLC5_9ERIC|nr:hypothetical protein RHGRI_001160 [Rhododendron griersonianum]